MKRQQDSELCRRNNNTDFQKQLMIIVAGKKGDYWKRTLTSWCYEIKELLEHEYNIRLIILDQEENCNLPRVYIDGMLVFEGVPGEEGYLIELLKIAIEQNSTR